VKLETATCANLAVGGASSTSGPFVEEMMLEVAEEVRSCRIPRTAHRIPEENPDALTTALLDFVSPP
jgi:hypothetical protein